MEYPDEGGQPVGQSVDLTLAQARTTPAPARPAGTPVSYVFALGQIEPRFPSLAAEKELARVTGQTDTSGLTDRQALQSVLSQPANRYLLRQLCWVMTIEGIETYILYPRFAEDFSLLRESLRPTPGPTDVDVVIGIRGPLAPAETCNGLIVPIVAFDQIYFFDRESLIRAIPKPEAIPEERFRPAAEEVFNRIIQMADNGGADDGHRAVNYLAVSYPAIYSTTMDAFARNASLEEIEVRPSRLSGVRKLVDVIFSYTHRQTGVTEKYCARVDVTEEFPFLASRISQYYER